MAKFVQSTPFFVPDQVEISGNARRISWHAVYEVLDDTTVNDLLFQIGGLVASARKVLATRDNGAVDGLPGQSRL